MTRKHLVSWKNLDTIKSRSQLNILKIAVLNNEKKPEKNRNCWLNKHNKTKEIVTIKKAKAFINLYFKGRKLLRLELLPIFLRPFLRPRQCHPAIKNSRSDEAEEIGIMCRLWAVSKKDTVYYLRVDETAR
jgi:hypothetical protein